MKRRKLLYYGSFAGSFLVANAISLHLPLLPPFLPKAEADQFSYEWIFLYWMPYDNNLSALGESILEMIRRGLHSENILVVIQADFFNAPHLRRYCIHKNQVEVIELETADSSSVEVFSEYLRWASSQFRAQKWAVVFLGHGGRLDHISPDQHPHQELNPELNQDLHNDYQWMNLLSIREAIALFNQQVGQPVELLFFQNCNKGTLEVLYTFRDVAVYSLSSQLLLGAPNAYYEQFFSFLANNFLENGGEIAAKIIEFETPEMYHSYTLIENQGFYEFGNYLKPVIDAILQAQVKAVTLRGLEIYEYMGDTFVDLMQFLQGVTFESKANPEALASFRNFLQSSVIVQQRVNGQLLSLRSRQRYQGFSGLGLFFPKTRADLDRYSDWPVFRDLQLLALFEAILAR